MPTLYIVGAGASRNYSQANHGIKDLKMPLDNDFFRMAKRVMLSNSHNFLYPLDLDMDHLLDDLWELYKGKNLPSKEAGGARSHEPELLDDYSILDDPRLSLENVMSLFSHYEFFDKSFGVSRDYAVKRHRLKTLIALIAYTLTVAQNGPICNKHLRLAKAMREGDIVFSFNYDTILDNALRKDHKLNDSGYLLDFYKVCSNKKWISLSNNDSKIMLLKLHGSLNWLKCDMCGTKYLYRDKVSAKTRSDIEKYLATQCVKCGEDLLMRPLIVPPLAGKDYHESDMNYLWSSAAKIAEFPRFISEPKAMIEEIVVIGYRLPDSDTASLLLLRNLNYNLNFAGRTIPLTIINPDKSIILRFKDIFPSMQISHFKNMEEYVRQI